jgi:hypothetical protein
MLPHTRIAEIFANSYYQKFFSSFFFAPKFEIRNIFGFVFNFEFINLKLQN